MSLTERANGSTPLRRLILYIVFVIVGFIYVLFDESFWDIAGRAQAAADERNARNLVDLYQAASIAGSTELNAVINVSGVVSMLVTGVEGEGAFDGMVFKMPLDREEIVRTENYLRLVDGQLVFRSL